MNYDLIISEIRNSKALTILAQQLTTALSISHQKAFSLLKKLPCVLANNIDEPSMQYYVEHYHQFGVVLKAVQHEIAAREEKGLISLPPVAHKILQDKGIESRLNTSHRKATTSPAFTEKTDSGNAPSKLIYLNKSTLLLAMLVVIVIAAGVFFVLNPKFFYLNFGNPLKLNSESFPNNTSGFSKHKQGNTTTHKKRSTLAKAQIDSSNALCDSAKSIEQDLNAIINFYKIAISFNRYNFNAWSGLLSTYKKAGMNKQYQRCLKDMKEIFGDQALTVSGIVQRYGIVKDIYTSEESVLTISYTTETGSEESRLHEIYAICKLLSSHGNGNALTLSATFEKSSETIVHVRPGMDISTFENFRKNASVHIFN